jgi:hypothetical protein
MMTDTQLETAAREYCRLTNMDPDQEIEHPGPPNPDGEIKLASVYWPRWQVVAEKIAQVDIMQHCMDVGKSDTRVPVPRGSGPAAISERMQRILSWFPAHPRSDP